MKISIVSAVFSFFLSLPAFAAVVDVFALGNSVSGGTGASTGVALTAGQNFSVTVPVTDLWSAGSLPRWSNADGLKVVLLAKAGDESGQPVGTQIGGDFGLLSQSGLSLPFGSLVGEISGTFFLLGTNFFGPAPKTGALNLFFWDSNNSDNSDKIAATVTAGVVAEPPKLSVALAVS